MNRKDWATVKAGIIKGWHAHFVRVSSGKLEIGRWRPKRIRITVWLPGPIKNCSEQDVLEALRYIARFD